MCKTTDLFAELQRLAICCHRRTGHTCSFDLQAGEHGVSWDVIVWGAKGAALEQIATWRGMVFHDGRHSEARHDVTPEQARDGLVEFIAQHKREAA